MTVAGDQPDPPEGSRPPGWLLLTYRVPSEPSRLRATVWRRLKSHGAVYLHSSLAVLPDSPGAERALRTLRAEIGELGGTASLLRAEALAGGVDIVAAYNAARDDEYAEILDKCRDFLAEIENETAASHFTYAELEENEEDLTKLRRWLEKVTGRDTLTASGAGSARAALDECVIVLEEFAQHVYAATDDGT